MRHRERWFEGAEVTAAGTSELLAARQVSVGEDQDGGTENDGGEAAYPADAEHQIANERGETAGFFLGR